MIGLKGYAIAALLALLLSAASAWKAYNIGKDVERAEQQKAILALQDQLRDIKTEAQKKINNLKSAITAERRKADAKVRKLLAENKALKEWWEMLVPDDAVTFAYGLQNNSDQSMRRGQDTVIGNRIDQSAGTGT